MPSSRSGPPSRPAPPPGAKVKLVSIIVPFERVDGLVAELEELGVKAYTSMDVKGRGIHGPRRGGVLDGTNTCFEVLASPELARRILDRVESKHADEAIVAFAVDAEAAPRARFT